ncbi:DoxX family protein [Cellulomonas wangsupingiae]|uniref:DoxX family protein n=1 Tax=Cellulomonas wangsupingiae TaxID=2968085 RepID=A0ABY5K6N0_9CELL|nr:DoxX family protein [Cellulomonas wangsupingiae]MCC2333804.1 DoxX family protein [Cellulomonas wangsupingiae]MCM0639376.1 DoxX family protein [Cellulomonas wangsupingiae]UUI65066.1 DoxX family protein [Cellulomonas wangsupingiae]
MNTALWIVQILLAVAFVGAGAMKAGQPREKLEGFLPWVADFSTPVVRFIGVAEVLGGLGLVLPAATGIAPVLTPVAATALAVTMVLAAVVHARRREYSSIGVNVVLLLLAAFVAWGRFGPYAF